MRDSLQRVHALLGEASLERLAHAHILIVGVGAVGGACAEALARSGVGKLTIVDGDVFVASNLNRQPFATTATLGQPKTTATADELACRAPTCAVTPIQMFLTAEDVPALLASDAFTALIDCCDDLPVKVALLATATERGLPVWSAMGAARKLDPTKLRVTDLSKTEICPLARNLRQTLRKRGITRGIRCVWSTELPQPLGADGTMGSLMPVTASAGLMLAADCIHSLLA